MVAPLSVDPRLKDFAAPRQKELIEAIEKTGSLSAACKLLDMDKANASKTIKKLEARAARGGYAPGHWQAGVAPGYLMGKVTVQRANGAVERTWERQHPEAESFVGMVRAAVAEFIAEVQPVTPAPSPSGPRSHDIVPWINIGDAHLGMLAHEAETGENFDLKIAERELCAAIAILIDEMQPVERLVINDLGDFTHYENMAGVTEASHHQLDFDGRFPRMIKTYSRVMRFIVEKALEKAQTVDVIVNQGNHSRTNDIWMAELLRVAYGHTGRVNVLNNDNVFIAYRMGNTLVMTHHSDKCRPHRLAAVMTTDYRTDYGETEYHYVDIGHIHHGMVLKEHPDISIESFNTLAPKDKWAHDGGWRSRSSIAVVFRSRTYGDVGRRVLPIREVRDRIVAACKREGREVYVPTEKRAFAA